MLVCVRVYVYVICRCRLSVIAMVLNAITALLLIYSRESHPNKRPQTINVSVSATHAVFIAVVVH